MTSQPVVALLPNDWMTGWRAPRLRVIANGQVLNGAMEAEVISNNHYAADRFSASVALGIDPWADISFWASESNILLEVQFSLDGGATFTSLIQGGVDAVSIDPALGLVHLDGRDLTTSLIEFAPRRHLPIALRARSPPCSLDATV